MLRWTHRSSVVIATIVAATLCAVYVTAQTPGHADAAITGVVIDGATKQPIADAVVQLGSASRWVPWDVDPQQFTDAKGRFVFTDLEAGSDYAIRVVKSGYVDGAYGRSAGSLYTLSPISIVDGEWFRDATVTLWRPSSASGTVFDEHGQPVIGVYVRAIALVRVAGRDRYAVGPLATTDDRGMYRIDRLTPGRYVVMVPSVQASAPATASTAVLRGLPAAMVARAQAAGRPLTAEGPMVDVDATTRVGVGGYPIPPPPVNGRAFAYPMAFSGGRSLAQATSIVVDTGSDRTGVDVRLDPVPVSHVSGVVQGPPDAIAGVSLRLLAEGAEDLGIGGEVGTSLVAPDGSFVFANVPLGTYTIEAPVAVNQYTVGEGPLSMFYGAQLPRTPGWTGISTMGGPVTAAPDSVGFSATALRDKKYWGRTTITVTDADVANVVVTLRPAGSIRGRLVGEADPAQPEPPTPPQYVDLEAATGSAWEGSPKSVYNRTAPPGEFIIDGVLPGLYLFRTGDRTWTIKSVIVGGRDYTYTPLDTSTNQDVSGVVITFTNAMPSLTGTARDASGAPAARAAVIVFPAESGQWSNFGLSPVRISSVHTSNAGGFQFRSIPAGDYDVVAVPEAQASAWQEPGFLERANAVATRVTIAWGQKKTIDVRVTEIR